MYVIEKSNIQARNHKRIYTTTVISISMVLLMMGIAGALIINTHKLTNYVKENIVLNVYLKDRANDKDITKLNDLIKNNPAVKSSTYIRKEDAAKILSKELGEDFVNFLGYNPLLNSIDVYLKADYTNETAINKFIQTIEADPLVGEVVYQPSLVASLTRNVKIISSIIIGFGIILLIISLALINNTIKLAIYSQRFLIKSMQLVGATDSFIRRPFLNNAILNGIISGIVASIMLFGIMTFMCKQITELQQIYDRGEYIILFIFLILLGAFISMISTYRAVSKYIYLKSNDELYV
jgi:cell division transport system permease protein